MKTEYLTDAELREYQAATKRIKQRADKARLDSVADRASVAVLRDRSNARDRQGSIGFPIERTTTTAKSRKGG